ncbi:hypothetical protein ITJ50_09610 [Curtobacterium sp. VKM Ac-2889]|uniref:Uncharacterized protein n=1 Tax=Curtobacterium poinsettiae TaxID=159612 RepID=A0ABT3S6F7_9MICO|nr:MULTISPECIES: hypothetical protein [Curtobacterium]MBF4596358.1 hypothetical protein [Curtobacterium sp. VKM Ac-1796]MBF4611475.1 hypothetical protein [Curtobacterium sp. VKM Ac-2889]MBT1611249.1 hypothetical protein [Curtobacterium flaccumfaciens pv. poinsettiae]MCX2849829.1 hypothetical protein [Curtobacterium flaccumfaciens pv. poinsettiae]UXN19436.1 hypothetical protein N8D78_04790 [Curtobacterium flaccumfaciens pv. poinsettiae]
MSSPVPVVNVAVAAAAFAAASDEWAVALRLDPTAHQVELDLDFITNLPEAVAWVEIDRGSGEAIAVAAPNDRPDTMVAAASPAAPMDLRAVDALFL